MEAGSLTARGGRSALERSSRSRAADPVLRWVLTGLAGLILVLIAFFFIRLFVEAKPAFDKFGYFGFVFDNDWDVSKATFGAWPLVVGTLITSVVALVIGVPVAVATALYITELCPRRLRQPLTIMVEPIVSAISREVMSTVPSQDKEGALALGATRWEMIRMAVLPYSRAGISGAAMLGLGRALGETIAATLVIGNAAQIGHSIFSQGYTLAAVIANEFGEASSDPTHRPSPIAAGLVLFVLTL